MSHLAAAWLWGLRDTLPRPVEVSIPSHGHRRKGIWTYRIGLLGEEERALSAKLIPTTSLPRTLLDIAATATVQRIESVVELAERLFKALIKRAGLPYPALNVFIAGHEIDAYWEAERFAVEIDGWGTHRTRAAFERDPLRQEELLLAGITCIRITARRIEREPDAVAARLARHLAKRRQDLGL